MCGCFGKCHNSNNTTNTEITTLTYTNTGLIEQNQPRLTEDALRIYEHYNNHTLIGLFNVRSGEIHLFPALHSEETERIPVISTMENWQQSWELKLNTGFVKLDSIPTENLNGQRLNAIPRYLILFEDLNLETSIRSKSLASHEVLINYIKDHTAPPSRVTEIRSYANQFRGFSLKRLDTGTEYQWRSRSINGEDNNGTMLQNYQWIIKQAFEGLN